MRSASAGGSPTAETTEDFGQAFFDGGGQLPKHAWWCRQEQRLIRSSEVRAFRQGQCGAALHQLGFNCFRSAAAIVEQSFFEIRTEAPHQFVRGQVLGLLLIDIKISPVGHAVAGKPRPKPGSVRSGWEHTVHKPETTASPPEGKMRHRIDDAAMLVNASFPSESRNNASSPAYGGGIA